MSTEEFLRRLQEIAANHEGCYKDDYCYGFQEVTDLLTEFNAGDARD